MPSPRVRLESNAEPSGRVRVPRGGHRDVLAADSGHVLGWLLPDRGGQDESSAEVASAMYVLREWHARRANLEVSGADERDLDLVEIQVPAHDGEQTLEDALLGREHQPVPGQPILAAPTDPFSFGSATHHFHELLGQGLRGLGVETQTGDGASRMRLTSRHRGGAVARTMGDAADEACWPNRFALIADSNGDGRTPQLRQGRAGTASAGGEFEHARWNRAFQKAAFPGHERGCVRQLGLRHRDHRGREEPGPCRVGAERIGARRSLLASSHRDLGCPIVWGPVNSAPFRPQARGFPRGPSSVPRSCAETGCRALGHGEADGESRSQTGLVARTSPRIRARRQNGPLPRIRIASP
jgi:hypothetical protein